MSSNFNLQIEFNSHFPEITNTSTLEPTTQFSLTKTSRGGLCLLEGGFCYTKHRITKDITQWHCVQREVCKARIHTKGQSVVAKKGEHTHVSNSSVFHATKAKAGIKRKASETQEATHSIVTSSITHLDQEAALNLPKIDSLKRTIVRCRTKAANVPPEPTSLANLEIPYIYTVTDKDERFLLYDSGIENDSQRILIFATDYSLDILSSSRVWLADGTFKTVPSLFYQLYVIHALVGGQNLLKDGHLIPSIFVLLPNKSENVYTRMWNKIRYYCPTACPTHLIVDFEKAAINSFSATFPYTEVKGCFFHLCQNIWRKIQQFGLTTRYMQDAEFALKIRMLPALAFATTIDIPDLFRQMLVEFPIEAYELALYFESTYIGRYATNSAIILTPMFSLQMWNNHLMVQHGLPRTTNAVEAWHRSFSCHMSCHHPSIWRFLETLKKEQGLVEVKQAFYISGRDPPKRRCNEQKENAIETLIQNYLIRPKEDFLKGIAYSFSFND